MSHLRLISSSVSRVTLDESCLFAFQNELDYIYRTLRRLGVAPSETDDLVQEVFLALRGAWDKYDPLRPLRPYLFGIAFRIASANKRKRSREIAIGVVEVDSDGPGPEDALETKQTRAMVLVALGRIPLPRRAVLVMHELEDVPIRQVASVLSIPLFTAYSRLRKARREFRTALHRMMQRVDAE